MDLDLNPRWVMWKAELLEMLRMLTDAFALSEVAKPVPPSEMVLVCWGYFEVDDFHSEFVVALVVMVQFVSVV